MTEPYNPIITVTSSEQRAANRLARAEAWNRRLAWFRERSLKPRLLDADDLTREAAGLPPDPPFEREDGTELVLVPITLWDGTSAFLEIPNAAVHSGAPDPDYVEIPFSLAPIHPDDEVRNLTKPITAGTAKVAGYSGETCECGSFAVKRTGTCLVCEDCHQTSGCS